MTEANTRGEVTIELEGVRYVMRPSYEAIEAIEEQTGHGIVALINLASQGEMTRRQCAIVVTECIKAWGKQQRASGGDDPIANGAAGANTDKIARLIHASEGGVVGAVQRVAIVLTAAACGGVTETGEMKPATMKGTLAAG